MNVTFSAPITNCVAANGSFGTMSLGASRVPPQRIIRLPSPPMRTFAIDPHKLEELLNYCIDFAKQMIESHGAFHPFGAVIVSSGTLNAVGADVGEEHPHGAKVFQFLQRAMRAQFEKGEIIAASIAADVNIPPDYQPVYSDGVRVLMECAGYSRYIYLPYRISNGKGEYGEFISVDVPATICA
jgi:hypothetical protein